MPDELADECDRRGHHGLAQALRDNPEPLSSEERTAAALAKLLDAMEGLCHSVRQATPFAMPAMEEAVKECRELLKGDS